MAVETDVHVLNGKNSGHNEEALDVDEEFRLDKLVKWLSVYKVAAIASFLVALQELFKGHGSGSISCVPITTLNNSRSYDVEKPGYVHTYCLEKLVDYTLAVTNQLSSLSPDANTNVKVLYQRHFPYVLGVQAAICAGPVVFWKMYGSRTLKYAVKYVAGKLGAKKDHEVIGDVEEALDEVNEPDKNVNKPNVKTTFISSTSIPFELRKQITSWWNQTSLTKRYVAKLLFKEVIFILAIFFYLGVDGFSIRDIKFTFLCHVEEKEFVKCSLAGVALLRMAWYVNLVLVGLALVLNTLQLMNIFFCANKSKQSFLRSWHTIAGEKTEKRCRVFLNDALLIAAAFHENIGKLPSTTAQ